MYLQNFTFAFIWLHYTNTPIINQQRKYAMSYMKRDIFSTDDMQYSNMVLTQAINLAYFDPHPRRHIALS